MKKLVRVVDVACLAIVFASALTESVDAQQLYKKDNCMYQHGSNQLVGCYSYGSGRLWYYDVPNRAMRDERTGVWMAERNGVMMIWTTQGWYPMHAHPQGQQIIAEIQAANQQQRVTPGNLGVHPTPGGGTTLTFPGLPSVTPNAGGGVPGAGAPSSGGGFITPDCRPQRGIPCNGRYDNTPPGDVGTHRDANPNNRPGNPNRR